MMTYYWKFCPINSWIHAAEKATGSFWHSTKNKTTSQNCTAISHTPEITYNSLSQHIVVSVTKIAVINSTRDSLHMILSSIYSMIRVKSSIFDLQSYKSSYIGRKSSILRHNSKHLQSLINQYLCQNLFFNDKTPNLQSSWTHVGRPILGI